MACAVFTGTGDFSAIIFGPQPWQLAAMRRAAASQNPNVAALPAPTPCSLVGVFTLWRGEAACGESRVGEYKHSWDTSVA